MNDRYIFKSARLGFRRWTAEDLSELATMNADSEVMEHFPNPLTRTETATLLTRLQSHYDRNGYTYYATEILETGELIGFIGLARQVYDTAFTPATDIGWRLKKTAWGHGYATEGAKRCLEFAFEELKLDSVIATCTMNNTKSEHVMKKIGMTRMGVFYHPELKDHPEYQKCIWYAIQRK